MTRKFDIRPLGSTEIMTVPNRGDFEDAGSLPEDSTEYIRNQWPEFNFRVAHLRMTRTDSEQQNQEPGIVSRVGFLKKTLSARRINNSVASPM